jgi:2-keto-4-pentenoate hydratase/2-oxohepta-3-ene-1,7-dioic acid hydratase in catechol pathway
MRIYRFEHDGGIFYGVLKEENLHFVSGSIFKKFRVGKRSIPISRVSLLPPVEPTKIVGIGRNYPAHSRELGNPIPKEPLIFLKPPSAVIGPEGVIARPEVSERVDYEGELAVVMGKEARRLSDETDVGEFILGYTCFNDVTAETFK